MRTALAALILGLVLALSLAAAFVLVEPDRLAERASTLARLIDRVEIDTEQTVAVLPEPAPAHQPAPSPTPPQAATQPEQAAAPPPAPTAEAPVPPATQPGTQPAQTTTASPTASAAEPPELVAPASRNVTPPGMTPAPYVDGPMERLAMPPPPPPPARWRRFPRVLVVEPGLLELGDRKVRLAGIEAPPVDRICGKRRCGRMALAAMRGRIRTLGIECFMKGDETDDPVVAPCRIGRQDLALWLVRQGWAEPTAAAPEEYRTANAEARCARRGLFAEMARPETCPPP